MSIPTLAKIPYPAFTSATDEVMCGTHQPDVLVQVWTNDVHLCDLPIISGEITADRTRIPLMQAEVTVSEAGIEWARYLDAATIGYLPQTRHLPFGTCLAIWAGADGEIRPVFFGEITEVQETGAAGTIRLLCDDPSGYLTRNFAGGLRAVPRTIDSAMRRADHAAAWLWGAAGRRGIAQTKSGFAYLSGMTYRTLPATYAVGGSGETAAAAQFEINRAFGTALIVSPTIDGATLATDPPVLSVPASTVLPAPALPIEIGRNLIGWDRNYGRSPNQLLTAITDGSATTGKVDDLQAGFNHSFYCGTYSTFRTHAKTVDASPGADYLAAAAIRARRVEVQAVPHAGVWLRRRCNLLLDDPPNHVPMIVERYSLPLDGSAMTVGLIPEAEDWSVEE